MSVTLNQAIIALMTAEQGFTALMGDPPRIHDEIPRKRRFPFMTIGTSEVTDWSTDHERGYAEVITLDLWSRSANRQEIRELAGSVDSIITRESLAAQGFATVLVDPVSSTFSFSQRDEAFFARLRFRILRE